MLVELTKVEVIKGSLSISRVYVNPQHVVSVVEDNLAYNNLKEGLIEAGVHEQFSVSKMILYSGGSETETVMIMGNPRLIKEKLDGKRQILRG
jgi:hypothetical protein